MQKKIRKLVLNRETLRSLQVELLRGVEGGIVTATTCNVTCRATCDCHTLNYLC